MQILLLLCPGLTLEDVRDNDLPHLAAFAAKSAVGLMNAEVNGEKSAYSTLATLVSGQQVAERPPAPHHLGAALAAAKRKVVLYGALVTDRTGSAATLFAPDEQKPVAGNPDTTRPDPNSPYGRADNPALLANLATESDADLVILALGDLARTEAMRPQMTSEAYREARRNALRRLNLLLFLLTEKLEAENKTPDILLVSLYPPSASQERPFIWNRLPPLLASGSHFPPGLLLSSTTRTPGLVANVDVAPTLLQSLRAPIPPTMEGRPMRVTEMTRSEEERFALLARQDYLIALNERALMEVTPILFGVCAALVLIGLWARLRGWRWAKRFAPVLVVVQWFPAALLLAPLAPPPTLIEYALRIVGWSLGLTIFSSLLGRAFRTPPPLLAATLTLILIVGDILSGQHLQKDCLICRYALSSLRYYGVGNEYLGVSVGYALALGFFWLDTATVKGDEARWRHWLLAACWLSLPLIFGAPGLGANAGSLPVMSVGFGMSGALLAGKRPGWKFGVVCALGGLAVAFGFSALDRAFAGSEASHLGAALQASSGGRGVGYLAEIALRKVGMNLRLLISPWFLLGTALIFGVLFAAQKLLGEKLKAVWERYPWLGRGRSALAGAALTAAVFKDSGVVTAMFLLSAASVLPLWLIMSEETHSTHGA